MLLMSLPGFTSGEKAQNVVVAAMYLVAIVAIVGGAAMLIGLPGSVGGSSAASSDSGAVEKTQTPSQSEKQVEGSGWETPTPSADSSDGGSSTGASTQRISEDEVQMTLVRDTLQNSSRVEPLSIEIRQNELYVKFTQDDLSQSEVRSGVGEVAGTYLGLVPTGADLQAIHGKLMNDQGEVAYKFTIGRETAVKYNNGEISDQQLRQTLIESIQPANQSSTPISLG